MIITTPKKVCLISANIGGIDPYNLHISNVDQTPQYDKWIVSQHYFTDANMPNTRENAFMPRLRAKIPKMLGWQLLLDHDYYIWMDSSFTLSHPDSIAWMIDMLSDGDIALFRHPQRQSIKQELEYMELQMSKGNEYLLSRYTGEPMRKQVEEYLRDEEFIDNNLWACGVFIYRMSSRMAEVLMHWYVHCCIYSIQDQLSFPYLMSKCDIEVRDFGGVQYKSPYVKWHMSHENVKSVA